jgi:hypothetical protein
MSNEQVKELLDMVMALPQSDSHSVKFEYCTDDGDISIFVHGKKRCECCGRLEDVSEFKLSDKYDVIEEFINKWKEIIENE